MNSDDLGTGVFLCKLDRLHPRPGAYIEDIVDVVGEGFVDT
jgi:hypothetical protein